MMSASDKRWVYVAAFLIAVYLGFSLNNAAVAALKSGEYQIPPALTPGEVGQYSCAIVNGVPAYVLGQEKLGTRGFFVKYAGGDVAREPAASVVLTDCKELGLMKAAEVLKAPIIVRLDAGENRQPALLTAISLSVAAFGLQLFLFALMAAFVILLAISVWENRRQDPLGVILDALHMERWAKAQVTVPTEQELSDKMARLAISPPLSDAVLYYLRMKGFFRQDHS